MKRKAKRLLSLLLAFTLVLQSLPASVLTVNATNEPETVSVTTVPSGVGTAKGEAAGEEEYYFEASVNEACDASVNGTGYKFWKFTYEYDGMSLEESKDNPLTLIKVDGGKSLNVKDVKALFSYVYKDTSRVITVRINGDGKVSLKKENDTYEFTAVPAAGYNFVDLAVPEGVTKESEEDNTVVFSVDSKKIADNKDFVITANFEEGYKLTVDGKLVSPSNKKGTGWEFTQGGTTDALVLDKYNGGSIDYSGDNKLAVTFKGENKVAGEICAAIDLTLIGAEDGAKLNASSIKAETVTFNSGKVKVLSENGCAITGIVNVRSGVTLTAETKLSSADAKAIDGSVNNAIAGKGTTSDNKTYSIETTTVAKDLEKNFVKVEFATHIHAFQYYEVADGTVTADCSVNNCVLTDHKVSLTIKKPAHETYGDGLSANAALEGLDDFNEATGLDIKEDSIEYYSDASTNKLNAAPTDAGNYKAKISVSGDGIAEALVASVSYEIKPAKVTVSAADAEKIYGEDDPEFKYEVIGLVSGDKAEMIKVTSLTREEGENAGTYAIIPRGSLKQGNYNVAYTSGTLTINRAPVTVSACDESKKFGEDDPEFTWTASGIKNGENAEKLLEVDLTRDPGEGVGTYDIVASGAKNQGNYVVSYKKAKFTISENDALFTAPKAIEGLSFNGAAQELIVSGNVSEKIGVLQYTVSDNKDEEPKEGWSTDVPKATDAGTYYVWYRIDSKNPNYKSAEAKYIEASINKAVVTVYAVDASKTYGDEDPAFSAAVVGLKNKDTITYSLTREKGEDAGSYEIGFGDSETEQGNYVIDYVPAEFTILPAKATVTAYDKESVYGEADVKLTYKVEGLKGDDKEDILSINIARAAGTDVGEYTITPSGAEVTNYTVNYVTGKYTIKPATAEITVLSANKTYGEADPEFKWEVTGLKNNDKEAVIKDAVTIIREPGEDVGEYAILASCDKKAGNYSLKVVKTAKLTIEKKVVKVTGGITANWKYYDGTTAAELNTTYATVEGAVKGDNIGVTAKGEFSDAKASADINGDNTKFVEEYKTVNIKDIALTGEKADNYSLSSNGNQTKTERYGFIVKAPLTIKAVANSKKYGDTDPEFKYTYEGIVPADKAEDGTVSKNVITGELARVTGEEVGEYDILKGTLAAANYHINFTGAKFTILPNNEIKPTVSVQGWIYGSFDAETNAPQVTGNFGKGHETYFYKAEGADVWTAWNAETVAKLPAGKYNVSANVAATTSYNAAYTEEVGSFTVEQRQIGLAWSDTALTYNGKAQKPEATAIGTVFDDAIAVTVTGEKTNAGSYVAEATGLTGATAASYKLLPPTTAFFTIGKAAATITINDKNKIYGAADPEFTADTVVPVENEVLNYTISREAGEDAGTYDIRVTLGENPNYDVEIVKAKLTINKAASAVTKVPVANTLVANGKSQALIAEGATEDGVMIYAVTDTDAAPEAAAYKTAIPTATNAGNYYVWFKVRGDANHNDSVPENIKVTIDKPATIAVRPYAKTDLTENGTEQELVTEGSASNGKLMYALGGTTSPASGWSTAVPKAKDAGTYYVWYYAAAENGRKDTIESCVVVAIAEAENAAEASANKIVSATAAKTGLVDNGEEQALIAVPAEELPEGYTMMYALGTDTVNVPETGWSTSIPVAKDAGVYYVWCYAAGEGDLNDTYAVCVTVIVEEKSAKVKAEEAKQANFAAVGDTAAIVPDASGKVWTLDASANDASSNEVTLKLTLTAGAKITLVGYDKKLSKQFKQFNKLSKKTATISTKGVLKAKKAGSGTLKYALAGGRVVTLDYTVVTPAVTVEKGSNISVSANAPGDAKKLNATYTAAGKFDVKLTGVPLNAVYTFSGNKVLNKDNIVIGSDGQIHITGEIAAKDKAKVVIYAQGKKLTVKITGKFK